MSKESKLCIKMYVDKDGKEFRNLPEDPSKIVAREFRFSNGEVRRVVPKDFPKSTIHGAILTGLGYVGGASLNNADGNVGKALELFDKRIKTLMAGKWAMRQAGDGTRVDNLIVSAIFAQGEDENREVDKDAVRDYMAAVDAPEADVSKVRNERRAEWLRRADVNAHYERIKSERQVAKALKAGKATMEPDTADDLFAQF